jgi:hypothetical protein
MLLTRPAGHAVKQFHAQPRAGLDQRLQTESGKVSTIRETGRAVAVFGARFRENLASRRADFQGDTALGVLIHSLLPILYNPPVFSRRTSNDAASEN